MNFERHIGGPVGFKEQVGHKDVNEGLHYCPVDENRFTQQNDMPKNVTKYKPEFVHAFGR